MDVNDRIRTWYSTARELVKQNNPKAARSYVLLILNAAREAYHNADTILARIRMEVFLKKWISVSRDLYFHGVTEYVYECFALNEKKVKDERRSLTGYAATASAKSDITSLISDAEQTQGWCAAVFENNKTAVAKLSEPSEISGTGFIISEKGYLLTNHHVVYDKQKKTFFTDMDMTVFGSEKRCGIEVLRSDKKLDVALCKFDPEKAGKFTVIKMIDDYSTVKQGADCMVIGNAFGLGLGPFTGVVRQTMNNSLDLVYSAPSNPGDSGAPVLNRCGECIGIHKSSTYNINGHSVKEFANATPIGRVKELVEQWIKDDQK